MAAHHLKIRSGNGLAYDMDIFFIIPIKTIPKPKFMSEFTVSRITGTIPREFNAEHKIGESSNFQGFISNI